jgi:hypothetical protein
VSRFHAGQRILVRRSGHANESVAEILQARISEAAELYRVRFADGVETFYVPGREARDRRVRDIGPPPGQPERRRPADCTQTQSANSRTN